MKASKARLMFPRARFTLVSQSAVARELGVDEKNLRHWVERGLLPESLQPVDWVSHGVLPPRNEGDKAEENLTPVWTRAKLPGFRRWYKARHPETEDAAAQ
jgi:transposase-like protein